MFCVKCGFQLGEGMVFCPSCGTKAYESQQVSVPANIPKQGVILPLLGNHVRFEESITDYVALRAMFKEMAEEISNQFYQEFNSKYRDMDHFIRTFESDFSEIFQEALEIVNTIFQHGQIFGVTKEELRPYIEEYCSSTVVTFLEIQDRYQEILNHQKGMQAYRELRKDSRGRVMGGGFGLYGAAKGMVTAGAINAAIGMLHSVGNAIGNMGSAIAAEGEKRKLFESGISFCLQMSIYNDILGLHYVVSEIISHYRNCKIKVYTETDEDKAEKICKDLLEGRIHETNQEAAILEMLHTFPFRQSFYEAAIRLYPTCMEEIRKFAEFFQIDVDEIYARLRGIVDPAVRILLEYEHEFDQILEDDLDMDEIEPLTTDLEDMLGYFSEIFGWCDESGFCVLPHEDSKWRGRLERAKSEYARCGQERPILLYDDTLGCSGKSGFLVTDRQVYIKSTGKATISLAKAIEDIHQTDESNGCQYLNFGNIQVHLLHAGMMTKSHVLDEILEFFIAMVIFLSMMRPNEKDLWQAVHAYTMLPEPRILPPTDTNTDTITTICEDDDIEKDIEDPISVQYCFDCGAENDPEDRFCCECGAELI